MRKIIYSRVVWLLCVGLFMSCGQTSQPTRQEQRGIAFEQPPGTEPPPPTPPPPDSTPPTSSPPLGEPAANTRVTISGQEYLQIKVLFNGTNYLIFAIDTDSLDVYALDATGNLLRAFPSQQPAQSPLGAFDVAVNQTNGEAVAVWQTLINSVVEIFIGRVSDQGEWIPGSGSNVSAQDNNRDTFPAIAFNRTLNEFAVIWSHFNGTSSADIILRRFDTDGVPKAPEQVVTTDGGLKAWKTIVHNDVDNQYGVAYNTTTPDLQQKALLFLGLNSQGGVLIPRVQISTLQNNLAPMSVAFTGTDFGIAFTDPGRASGQQQPLLARVSKTGGLIQNPIPVDARSDAVISPLNSLVWNPQRSEYGLIWFLRSPALLLLTTLTQTGQVIGTTDIFARVGAPIVSIQAVSASQRNLAFPLLYAPLRPTNGLHFISLVPGT